MNRNGTTSAEPTQQRLREIFSYRKDGHLVLKERRGPCPAGHSTSSMGARPDGYIRVKVDSRNYYLHRLVWIWHNGSIDPGVEIDHEKGIRADCRIEKLRIASWGQNASNKGKPEGCSSKYVGVCASSHVPGKWSAYLRVDEAQKYFGTNHDTEELAYAARVAAEKKYHKEFAAHRRSK